MSFGVLNPVIRLAMCFFFFFFNEPPYLPQPLVLRSGLRFTIPKQRLCLSVKYTGLEGGGKSPSPAAS
jgi:hypothetical protein